MSHYSEAKKLEVVGWMTKVLDPNSEYPMKTLHAKSKEAIDHFDLDVKPKTVSNWFKKVHGKTIKEVEVDCRITFGKISKTKIIDLIEIEDDSLEKSQGRIDEDIPYQEIIQAIEGLDGKVNIKMDGTIKGLVEATLLIGDRRRELRGVLPLKDEMLLKLRQLELEHRKDIDWQKLALEERKVKVLEDNKNDENDTAIKEAVEAAKNAIVKDFGGEKEQ